MIIVKLVGGLGNQLFIYAFGRSLAHDLDEELYLDISRFGFNIHIEHLVYGLHPYNIKGVVGNYSPDWAIAFNEGTVKHIFFVAETKGTMDSLNLRPIEQAKISCAKKLFNEISTSHVKYHDVDSYQSLLTIMNKL